MRYTLETWDRLVNEYSARTGKDTKKVSLLFSEGKLVEKYGSRGNSYLVENPDLLTDDGKFKKNRKKNSHLTPKKKKRK